MDMRQIRPKFGNKVKKILAQNVPKLLKKQGRINIIFKGFKRTHLIERFIKPYKKKMTLNLSC